VTPRIAADEPASRRTAASAPDDGSTSDWGISGTLRTTAINADITQHPTARRSSGLVAGLRKSSAALISRANPVVLEGIATIIRACARRIRAGSDRVVSASSEMVRG